MVPNRTTRIRKSRESYPRRLRISRTTTPSCGVVHSWRGVIGIPRIPRPGYDEKLSEKMTRKSVNSLDTQDYCEIFMIEKLIKLFDTFFIKFIGMNALGLLMLILKYRFLYRKVIPLW